MHLKYAKMLAIVANENMELGDNTLNKWEALTCKHKISDKIFANCSPYFTALQYINNLETKRSYKRKLNVKSINLKKKKSMEQFKNYSLICESSPKGLQTGNKSASIHRSYLHDTRFWKDWNYCEVKLHLKSASFATDNSQTSRLSIFTVFLTVRTLAQNISITLLQISLKLHEHRGGYWRKKLPKRFWKNSSQCREILLQVK